MIRSFFLLSVLCLSVCSTACRKEAAPPPPPERIIEYRAEPSAAIEGSIALPEGSELFGVMVFVEGTSLMSFTDSRGEYLITDLGVGDYIVRGMRHDLESALISEVSVREPDLEKEQPYLTIEPVAMQLRQVQPTTGAAPQFAALGNLRGRVLTTNPTDSQGVLVEISGTDMRTVTDATGSFVFYNLPVGDYNLSITHSGYDTRMLPVRVLPRQDNSAGEIRLDVMDIAAGLGRTLFGQIEMYDAAGNPVAEFDLVTVYLEGTEHQTRPDAAGQYQFRGIGAGRFVVTASAPGYRIEQRFEVDLTEIEAADVGLVLRPDDEQGQEVGSVAGSVLLEESQSGGHAGVAVSLAGTSSIAITGPSGDFLLSDVPEGYYDLVASLTGYETAYLEDVEVIAGEETRIGSIQLKLDRPAPEVVGTQPQAGAMDVPIEQPTEVLIQFNMKMNQQSLVDAIRVSPDVEYQIATAGRHPRASDDRVVVLLSGYTEQGKVLRFKTRYTIEISTAARSIDGVPMKEPHSFSFTTGAARVIGTAPGGDSDGSVVSPVDPIYVRFNAPISVSKFQADDIRIRPDIGTLPNFEVISDTRTGWGTLVITGLFEWDTKYTIRIGRGIETITGDRIENLPYTFSFRTRRVTENYPYSPRDTNSIDRQRKERDRR